MQVIKFIINRAQRYSFICYSYSMQFCQLLREKINNPRMAKAVLILISPLLVLHWIFRVVAEYTIGSVLAFVRREKEKKILFEDDLSIVAIAKNEAPYIIEWIEFHKIVGVSRFYIYDNESSDDLKDTLKPYIESGEVIYKFFPGNSKQLCAYNDALKKYKNKTRYMAFIDLDEFLSPSVYGENLPRIVDEILAQKVHAAGVGVTWRVFGSSGYEKKPEGLVTESYLYRGVDKCWQNYHIKTVCNPRLVKEYTSPHFPTYRLGAWNINEQGRRLHAWFSLGQCYDKIKINHYFCKSKEEALLKWNRGLADRNQKYDWKKFEDHDLNDVYDDGMMVYLPDLKERMNSCAE